MKNQAGKAGYRELFKAVASIRTAEEAERFLTDLCTPAELQAMADRWRVAKLLDKELPYREIYQRTGVSTATITRVARSLVYGESGYRKLLDRMGVAGKDAH
jgi:TrpR-related protein YerC/YecD